MRKRRMSIQVSSAQVEEYLRKDPVNLDDDRRGKDAGKTVSSRKTAGFVAVGSR